MRAADAATDLTDSLRRLAVGDDPLAWGAVLQQAGEELRRLALAITGDAGLADDVVQNTLLQVRADARQFQPRGDSGDADARRWLLRVCSNTALQALRSRRRSAKREALHAAERSRAAESELPEQALIARERTSMLRQALAELPEPMREPVLMRHLLGLPYEDVARRLGVPVGTAKVRVHRGLERLRTRLEREGAALSLALLITSLDGLRPDAPVLPSTALRHQRAPRRSGYARPAARLAPKLIATSCSLLVLVLGSALMLHRGQHEPVTTTQRSIAMDADRSSAAAESKGPAAAATPPAEGTASKRTLVTMRAAFRLP
jgi:RNA polymerase sigma-70 factor (ECF subfamily)